MALRRQSYLRGKLLKGRNAVLSFYKNGANEKFAHYQIFTSNPKTLLPVQ
jgi:hypothetical protein